MGCLGTEVADEADPYLEISRAVRSGHLYVCVVGGGGVFRGRVNLCVCVGGG